MSLVSSAQVAANRRNAPLSKGAMSQEGKAAVRKNALRHGLTSKQIVLSDEDPEEFAAMREALRHNLPDVEVLDAVAEDLPLADGAVDAAVAAQAFHWFDGERALSELARVLRPGAPIALVWNVRDESVPWIRGLTELIEPYRGDTPSHRSLRWRAAFDASDAFPPPELTSFPYVHDTTREGIVARVSSISFIATLAPDERERVAAAVRRLVPADQVAFAYRTDVWISRRT